MRSVLLYQRWRKIPLTLSSAQPRVLSSSSGTMSLFLILKEKGSKSLTEQQWKARRHSREGLTQCWWGREWLLDSGCHAFGAHIAHSQREDAMQVLIFPDAWTIPWSSLLPRTLLLSVWLHLRQVRWKLTTGYHWFFKHKAGKGENINGINMFQEKI